MTAPRDIRETLTQALDLLSEVRCDLPPSGQGLVAHEQLMQCSALVWRALRQIEAATAPTLRPPAEMAVWGSKDDDEPPPEQLRAPALCDVAAMEADMMNGEAWR